MHYSTKGEFRGHFFPEEHLTFQTLRGKIENCYLNKYPSIPKSLHLLEFHVSNLRHDTNLGGFQGILNDCGFKDPESLNPATECGFKDPQRGLLWWSLSVSGSEIKDAERRFLYERNTCNVDSVKPFLHKFTSSPAFLKSSRMGNFRFTFSIKEMLDKYSEQFCMGRTPQMSIYGTVVYKQEVMYAIVVYGPDGQTEFDKCPQIQYSTVCTFQNDTVLWRPQGMSKTHRFRLSQRYLKAYSIRTKKRKFYAWDHVAFAFHVPKDKVFKFNKETLLKNLSLCQGAEPKLSTEEFVKCDFEVSAAHAQG